MEKILSQKFREIRAIFIYGYVGNSNTVKPKNTVTFEVFNIFSQELNPIYQILFYCAKYA